MDAKDGYTVRQFQPNDLSSVQEVFVNGFHIYKDGQTNLINKYFTTKKLKEDMSDVTENYLKVDGANFWVACLNSGPSLNKIIGIIGVVPFMSDEADVYELQRLVVVSEHHGKGVGKALLKQLEHFVFEERHGNKIIFSTGDDMTKAQLFYERNGFSKTQIEEIPYKLEDGSTFVYLAQYYEKARTKYAEEKC